MLKSRIKAQRSVSPPQAKAKGGAKKYVLMLGDDGAILVLLSGTKVLQRAFAVSWEDMEQGSFRDILKAEPSAPILLLVDLIDQTFVQHNLPPVSSLNVTKLAQRRLDRDFSSDDLNGFVQLGRSSEGRKEWYYIFASVPNVAPLSKWVERLVELPNPFQGIYLLPMELQAVISKLEPDSGKKKAAPKNEPKTSEPERWHILVSHNKVGGVRQVVLRNGKLAFTRLSQMVGEDAPAVNAGNIEQEISSTKEYLKRLGLTDSARLFISVVLAEEVHAHIETARIGASAVNLLTPYQFAERLGLDGAVEPGDRYGDIACMVAIARQRKLLMGLHTKYTAQIRQMVQYQQLVRVIGALAIPAMLLYGGYNFYRAIQINGELSVQKDQLNSLNQTLASMNAKGTDLPGDIALINEYAAIYEKLNEQRYRPLELISRLLPAVSSHITAKKIEIGVAEFPGITGVEAPPPPPGQEQEVKPPVTMTVSLQFTEYGQDIERFTTDANAVLEVLQKNFPDYKVSYSKLPGSYSEQESLKVNIGKEENKALPDELVVDYKLVGPIPKDPNAPTDGAPGATPPGTPPPGAMP